MPRHAEQSSDHDTTDKAVSHSDQFDTTKQYMGFAIRERSDQDIQNNNHEPSLVDIHDDFAAVFVP